MNIKPLAARDLYQRLIELLRLNQQQSQFIGAAYGSPLSLLEMYVLIELDVDPARGAVELSGVLETEKSVLSRRIAGLIKSGCLKAAPGEDRRRKRLMITSKGRRYLQRHDAFTARQLAAETARLTAAELSELQGFFKALADGLQAKPVRLRPGEHPLLLEIRRFSRAYRITGPSLAESGYSSLEWQIFAAAAYDARLPRAVDLCRRFGVPANTMSQMLGRLVKRGLIARDGTEKRITLSEQGGQALRQIEDAAHRLTQAALRDLTEGELRRFLEVFAKYLGVGGGGLLLRPQLSVRRLVSAADRQAARGFLMLQLVRLNAYMSAPAVLLGEGSRCFGLFSGEALAAVCELEERGGAVHLVNFAAAADYDDSPLCVDFLRVAGEGAPLVIPEGSLARQLPGAEAVSAGPKPRPRR